MRMREATERGRGRGKGEIPDLSERGNIRFEVVDLLGIGRAESSSSHFLEE